MLVGVAPKGEHMPDMSTFNGEQSGLLATPSEGGSCWSGISENLVGLLIAPTAATRSISCTGILFKCLEHELMRFSDFNLSVPSKNLAIQD